MPTVPTQIEAIFAEAAEITDPVARSAHLARACGGDAALSERIEALLAAHDSAASFLQLPDESAEPTVAYVHRTEGAGTRIGRYKLLEEIGEGGFGVVFMAEQEEPVRRRVALKIIKAGMDTRQVVARFEAERQALAMMDHPNIARVFDAGATESGRPYFVMELVKGIPITVYCDQQRLGTDGRLKLFIAVCSAVQHAHQKGIIHRDLKPSNVLVTLHDDKPVPKIIDFGIAKATQARLTEKTLFTEFRQLIGTPAYMSPEQAQMIGLDVDTRSDIYSLGVLLYELLTGTTPFDSKELLGSGYDEMRRIIREVEPAKPSTKLSTSATIPSIAANRQTEPGTLARELRGDLDWIVMKCLEKDRTRRYETANGLAADIERHLRDEPVQACPPSAAYRFRKFARRNKVSLGFASLFVAGFVFLAFSNVVIKRERDAKAAALARATTESARAQAVSDLFRNMLASSYPNRLKDSQITVRELLDEFSAGPVEDLRGQPEVEAAIRSVVGRAYWRLGVFDRADLNLKIAVDLHRQVYGDHDARVADSLVDYAWNLGELDQFGAVVACAREAASIYQQLDADSEVTNALGSALYIEAMAQLRQGDVAGYRSTCSVLVDLPVHSADPVTNSRPVWTSCITPDALDDMTRPVKHAEVLLKESSPDDRHYNLSVLGAALYRAGHHQEAAQRLEESIDAYPSIPEAGTDTITYRQLLLAMTKLRLGERETARQLLADAQSAAVKELRAPSMRFNRRETLELLLHEAQALIETEPGSGVQIGE